MTICVHHMTVYGGGIATARWDGAVAGWAVRRRDCVSGWTRDCLMLIDEAGMECFGLVRMYWTHYMRLLPDLTINVTSQLSVCRLTCVAR